MRVRSLVHGSYRGRGPPAFLAEASLVHALELVIEYLAECGKQTEESTLGRIEIHAGNSVSCARLGSWFSRGGWRFESAVATRLSEVCYQVAEVLPCPLFLYCLRREILGCGAPLTEMDSGLAISVGTRLRAVSLIEKGFLGRWEGRMPRVPLMSDEIGELIRIGYEADELCAMRMMGERGSVSCGLYTRMGLTRDVVREAFAELSDCRARQVVLASIICATRFKYFEDGGPLRTTCGKCGEEDGFDHLLACERLAVPRPVKDPEPTAAFLVELA